MQPKTRAKFYVQSVTHTEYGAQVKLSAVHDSAINNEDNAFNAATPSGELTMSLSGKERAKFFTPGERYYIDFTLVPEGS